MKVCFKKVAMALLFIFLAFFMGTYAGVHLSNTPYKQGVQDGRIAMMDQLNQVLLSKGIIKLPLDTSLAVAVKVTSFHGFVKKVEEEVVILDIDTTYFDPLNGKRSEKKVMIDNKTEIVKVAYKSRQELENDGADNNDIQRGIGAGTSRMPIKRPKVDEVAVDQVIHLSDLKYGDYVQVVTEGEDFNTDDLLIASQIRIYPLEDNPYLASGVPTYENLPMGFGGTSKNY